MKKITLKGLSTRLNDKELKNIFGGNGYASNPTWRCIIDAQGGSNGGGPVTIAIIVGNWLKRIVHHLMEFAYIANVPNKNQNIAHNIVNSICLCAYFVF